MSVTFAISYQGNSACGNIQLSSVGVAFTKTQKAIHALIVRELAPAEQPLKFRIEGGSIDGSGRIKISNLANAKTISLWANIFTPSPSSASVQNQGVDTQPQKESDNERIPVTITEPLDFESGQCYHIKVINNGDALAASFSLVKDSTQTDRTDRERQFEMARKQGFELFYKIMQGEGIDPTLTKLAESMQFVKFSDDSDQA